MVTYSSPALRFSKGLERVWQSNPSQAHRDTVFLTSAWLYKDPGFTWFALCIWHLHMYEIRADATQRGAEAD